MLARPIQSRKEKKEGSGVRRVLKKFLNESLQFNLGR
jgi:hypothetical protein